MKNIGSKREVFSGTAKQTAGGLEKDDLMRNKRGAIVSKAQHKHGLRNASNLLKVGRGRTLPLSRLRKIVPGIQRPGVRPIPGTELIDMRMPM